MKIQTKSVIKNMLRRLCSMLLVLLVAGHVSAMSPSVVQIIEEEDTLLVGQNQITTIPSTETTSCEFRPQQLIVPGALITLGSFGICNGWLVHIKNDVRDKVRAEKTTKIDNYLQYIPLVTHVGLGLTGVKAKHPLRERVAVAATSSIALLTMTHSIKRIVKESRPDTGQRNSFPSGHTSTAFMGAELIREEYGNAWGAGAYVLSAGVAYLRLHNDRHWLNDVVAGAGFGILSARIGYWLLPLEKRLLGWEKKNTTTMLFPVVNPSDHSFSLAFSYQF